MNIPSPIAQRILTRHLSQTEPLHSQQERIPVILPYGSSVTATECIRLLAPKYGPLYGFRFHVATGTPNTVAFAALTAEGELLSGRVVVSIGSTERVVFIRAEIVVSPK